MEEDTNQEGNEEVQPNFSQQMQRRHTWEILFSVRLVPHQLNYILPPLHQFHTHTRHIYIQLTGRCMFNRKK
jgi:hypothetical protein